MILNPAIIALIAGSLLTTFFAAYASLFGLQIIRHWDIHSGSERQLALERRTYLISTVMAYLFALTLFSTFLFIYTGDHLHPIFVGAMCAAGTLNVNEYGYPLLMVKVIIFFLCGLWLIINHTDGLGEDYPLIRTKYRFMAVITLLMAADTVLTLSYFGMLRADVITSCCGTLFSTEGGTIAADLAALPAHSTRILLFLGGGLLVLNGMHVRMTGKGAVLYGWASTAMLIFGLIAVISVVSVYYYQLPTHHCPFDLLQKDYYYIGYPLYGALFVGSIMGAGVGVIDRFKHLKSLQHGIAQLQKRLCLWSIVGYIIFLLISAYPMVFTDFRLGG